MKSNVVNKAETEKSFAEIFVDSSYEKIYRNGLRSPVDRKTMKDEIRKEFLNLSEEMRGEARNLIMGRIRNYHSLSKGGDPKMYWASDVEGIYYNLYLFIQGS